VFDAWGKLPSGMSFGNTLSLGNYDLCMNIHHAYGSKLEVLTAQSCIVPMIENARARLFDDIDIYSSMKQLLTFHDRYSQKRVGSHNYDIPPFMTAVCVPAVCGSHRVSELVNDFVKTYNFSVPSFEGAGFCQSNERPALSASDWSAVVFFCIVGLLLIVSTVYNQTMVGLKRKTSNFLGCFSLYSNAQRLFSFKVHNSPDVLQCLNGIRFLSIVWIVYLHTNFIYMSQPAINSVHRVEWAQSVFAMFFHSGDIAVDTFLVIGGLLVTWQFLKERDQK
jgi:Nose resistant-to-fluoxetine protein, N-terminal domain